MLIFMTCFIITVISYAITETYGSHVTEAVSTYGFRLLNAQANESPNENAVLSPQGIASVMILVYIGAQGDTEREIAENLFNLSFPQLSREIAALYHFRDYKKATLQSETAILINKDKHADIYKNYWAIARTLADHSVYSDFSNHTIREMINNEVVRKKNKLADFIKPDWWNNDNLIVLVNKIYFKCDWARKFNPDATIKANFENIDGTVSVVNMMQQRSEKFGFYQNKNVYVLELPYDEENLSMYIITTETRNFKAAEAIMDGESLKHLKEKVTEVEMDLVQIPKFKIDSNFDLTKLMPKTGIKAMFSDEADLGRMTSVSHLLKISSAEHSAKIEVNEEGAEAQAETEVQLALLLGGNGNTFIVKQPFLFAVVDKANDNVLFLGRYVKGGDSS